MNKKIIVFGIVAVLVVVGTISSFKNNSGTQNQAPGITQVQTTPIQPTSASSTVPLMQSTGALFSQYKYFSKAHEVFPTPSADLKKTMGAFSYTKEDIGSGVYKFTLTNNAEGYKGVSVTVGSNQKVYFIERSSGDDSDAEDSVTTDDMFVAVDEQGTILK